MEVKGITLWICLCNCILVMYVIYCVIAVYLIRIQICLAIVCQESILQRSKFKPHGTCQGKLKFVLSSAVVSSFDTFYLIWVFYCCDSSVILSSRMLNTTYRAQFIGGIV